jgi:hypothetical protein
MSGAVCVCRDSTLGKKHNDKVLISDTNPLKQQRGEKEREGKERLGKERGGKEERKKKDLREKWSGQKRKKVKKVKAIGTLCFTYWNVGSKFPSSFF